jgi:hypothetical protein
LALFVRRIRRVMRDEKGRHLLGIAIGEGHFTIYPDVVRVLDWFGSSTGSNSWLALTNNPKAARSPRCAKLLKELPKQPDRIPRRHQ